MYCDSQWGSNERKNRIEAGEMAAEKDEGRKTVKERIKDGKKMKIKV